MRQAKLVGKRILVIEDEMLIALDLEDCLKGAGCEVVGPIGRLPEALAAANGEGLDGALLDVNIGGENSFPVALILEARGIPFLFLTGYGAAILPPAHSRWEVYEKPYRPERLLVRLADLLEPG